jgi:hypothetical protein
MAGKDMKRKRKQKGVKPGTRILGFGKPCLPWQFAASRSVNRILLFCRVAVMTGNAGTFTA